MSIKFYERETPHLRKPYLWDISQNDVAGKHEHIISTKFHFRHISIPCVQVRGTMNTFRTVVMSCDAFLVRQRGTKTLHPHAAEQTFQNSFSCSRASFCIKTCLSVSTRAAVKTHMYTPENQHRPECENSVGRQVAVTLFADSVCP